MKRFLRIAVAVAATGVLLVPGTAARAGNERSAKPHFVAPYSSSWTSESCNALDPNTTCSAEVGADEATGRLSQSVAVTSAHQGLAPNGYVANSRVNATVYQMGELKKPASALEVTMSVTVNEARAEFEGSRGTGGEPGADIEIYPSFYSEACTCGYFGIEDGAVIADTWTGTATAPGTELLLRMEILPETQIRAGSFEIAITSVAAVGLQQGNSGSVSAHSDLTVNWIEVDADYSP